ncbi:SufE family protein [Saxibacter everestensis]|uniref:SufE family protein n=1 Tax=Saxibacter everestensis TaxID=2909229 RepID=A0ABY8QWH2_9MICO|nr:SufE family protein [Brevibacteriaceae bacterium ZFBP1038]
MPATDQIPAAFEEIIDDFQALSAKDRLQLLLEFSQGLPDLPDRYAEHPELLERVEECQTPLFLKIEVGDPDRAATADDVVHLFFHAPAEAPTTKGFAGILLEGLDGESADTILNLPADLPGRLGLTEAVSPLRMRGMSAMLGRIQRQIRETVS